MKTEVAALDDSALDVPTPGRNFEAVRRLLRIVFCASVLIPVVFVVSYGFTSYHNRLSDATEIVERVSNVGEARVGKIMDAGRALVSEVTETIDTLDAVSAHQQGLEILLAKLVQRNPAVAAICVADEFGRVQASSLSTDEGIRLCSREGERSKGAGIAALDVYVVSGDSVGSAPLLALTQVQRNRRDRSGRSISVLIRQSYLVSLYEDLTTQETALTLGLYRIDGGLLARFPPPRIKPVPSTND